MSVRYGDDADVQSDVVPTGFTWTHTPIVEQRAIIVTVVTVKGGSGIYRVTEVTDGGFLVTEVRHGLWRRLWNFLLGLSSRIWT